MQWLAVLVDVYNVYFSLAYTDTVYMRLLTDACMCFLQALEKQRFIVSIPAHVLVLFVSVFGNTCFPF